MFIFRYTLSEKDYIEYNIFHSFNSPYGKRSMMLYRFIPPLVFIAIALALSRISPSPLLTWFYFISFGFVAAYWLIFFKRFMVKLITKNILKIKKDGKLPYQSDVVISFEDDFYVETTDSGETKTKYSAIERIAIDKEMIYLYTNVIQAVLLPFSAFSDNNNRNEFLNFIESKREDCKIKIKGE